MISSLNFKDFCGVRVIVFDLDGTLIDTMGYFGEIASRVINKYYNIPIPTAKKMYFETSGIPFFQQLEQLFPNDPRNWVAADEYEKNKKSFFLNVSFSKEIYDILKQAKNNFPEFIYAVSSNNFEYLVKEYMKKHNIDIFDEILGFREGFAKGRDHFNYLIEKYKLKKENIVFIGDSWWDAQLAIDNEIKFLGITTTFSYNEWKQKFPEVPIITKFKDLFEFLEVISKCKQ